MSYGANFEGLFKDLQKENAELKSRLANAIEPKFKILQKVFYISDRMEIIDGIISNFDIF